MLIRIQDPSYLHFKVLNSVSSIILSNLCYHQSTTHLGLPLSNKRLNKSQYLPLIHKITKKLSFWKASMLSIGGRLTLMNTTLTAMPMYMMQTFLLPKWVTKKIDQIRRRFLWHGHRNQQMRGMNLIAWEFVIKPKAMGGLGVLDLEIFNKALLAKIMFQWLQPNRPAWMDIVQLSCTTARPWELRNKTPFWASLAKIGPFLQNSVLFAKGKGTHIRFWQDNWGQHKIMDKYPVLYSFAMEQNISISRSIIRGNWHIKLPNTMSQMAADQLHQLMTELPPLNGIMEEDRITWKWTANGSFTVRSFYRAMIEGPYIDTCLQKIWAVQAPNRVMVFAWLMLQNRILTIDNLQRRGWQIVNRCCMCKTNSETARHLFSTCQYTRMLKMRLIGYIPELGQCRYFKNGNYKQAMLRSSSNKAKQVQMTTAFLLWRERCNRTFNDRQQTVTQMAQEVLSEMTVWFQAR